MDTAELFQRLGLALAIGLLIGLERGWRERDAESGSRTAGIRTFTLIGALGGIWGAMTPVLGPVPLAAAGFGFALAFAFFEWRELQAKGEFSVTSTVAGYLATRFGTPMAFLALAVVAVTAFITVLVAMPETAENETR